MTVSLSHGRMVHRSISSQETLRLCWAISATSLSTWTWVPQPISVTSLPGRSAKCAVNPLDTCCEDMSSEINNQEGERVKKNQQMTPKTKQMTFWLPTLAPNPQPTSMPTPHLPVPLRTNQSPPQKSLILPRSSPQTTIPPHTHTHTHTHTYTHTCTHTCVHTTHTHTLTDWLTLQDNISFREWQFIIPSRHILYGRSVEDLGFKEYAGVVVPDAAQQKTLGLYGTSWYHHLCHAEVPTLVDWPSAYTLLRDCLG